VTARQRDREDERRSGNASAEQPPGKLWGCFISMLCLTLFTFPVMSRKTLLQRLLLKECDKSDQLVHRVVREWISAYEHDHLPSFYGEVLEQERDWCVWLKAQAPRKFRAYLVGTGRRSPSVQTLRRWWQTWIEDHFIKRSLLEEWGEDYNSRKQA
jgi:hypothetical protein